MIALLANPLIRKIAIYGAVTLAALWLGRQWLNKHDNRVFQQGKESIAEELKAQKEFELKVAREALQVEKKQLYDTIDRLNNDMDKLHANLNEALKQVKKTHSGNAPTVMAIPDSDLNSAIRSELTRQ